MALQIPSLAAADILGSRILEINEQIITRLSLLERAARIAKDAAPYVHPRLAQIEHNGNEPVDIKVTMTLEPTEAYMRMVGGSGEPVYSNSQESK